MKKVVIKGFHEVISDPITLSQGDNFVVQHNDLPEVKDELSISLRLKLKSHTSDWATIFRKGNEGLIRTPGLWLTAKESKFHVRFTGNWKANVGIDEIGDGLLLSKWYHVTYTLSDYEKRMDFYVDGEWTGFYCIQDVKTQKVLFNDAPLYIGKHLAEGFNGEIGNFRYFNWRLSAEEVMKNYLNQPPFVTY